MVTHWESSRRPLYVQTIWKDGQHHVILDKTKENPLNLFSSRRSKECLSSQSSHRYTKSAGAGVNLKVSSVRVLLSSIKGFQNNHKESRIRDKSIDRPKTWTEPALTRPVTCKNLNNEVTFNAIQGFKPSSLGKSNIVYSEYTKHETPEKYQSNIALDNALSERVMLWLDLATHNSSPTERETKGDCNVKAQGCNIMAKADKQVEHIECNEKATEDTMSFSILKHSSPRHYEKRKEHIIVYSNEEIEIPQENFYHVLTPTVNNEECTYEEKSIKEENEARVTSVKRQLHIFMPNLSKKTSDGVSSILSSNISVN